MAAAPSNYQFLERVLNSITDPLVIYDCNYRIVMGNQALMTLYRRDPEQLIGRHCYEVFHGGRSVWGAEERYQTIVETAREGIFIADGEARVTFANSRLAGMLGYPLEEIVGRSLIGLMDEGSKTAVKEHLGRRRKEAPDVYELSFRSRDGTYLVGLVSATPLMGDDTLLGSGGIVMDITRMKQVESELRTAKEFSEKIINNITDNLIVVDPSTHIIVQANASFLDRIGHDLEEGIGRAGYEITLGRK